MTFADRLDRALTHAGMNQSELARALKSQPHRVGAWVNDGVIPSSKHLMRLPELLGVSGHWLLTGDGPMIPEDPERELRAYREIVEIVRRVEATPSVPDTHPAEAALERHLRDAEDRREDEEDGMPPGRGVGTG